MAQGKRPRFYTTEVAASKSAGEVVELLNDFGADQVSLQMQGGKPAAILFTLELPALDRTVAVQVAPDVDALARRLEKLDVVPSDRGEPIDVAWRQVKMLVEMRLEWIANGMETPLGAWGMDVLLEDGRTFEQTIEEEGERVLPSGRALLQPAPTP